MKRLLIILLLFFILIPCGRLIAQDADGRPPRTYTVITKGGDSLTGTFEQWAGDTLCLRGSDGEVYRVRKTDFVRIDESDIIEAEKREEHDDVAEAFRKAPSSSLILSPTAWPKPDGHPVIGVYEFAFASAAVSLGERVTIGGMASLASVYSVSMKFTPLVRDNVALAGGVWFVEGYPDKYQDPMQLYHVTGSFMWGSVGFTAGFGFIHTEDSRNGAVLYFGSEIAVTESVRILIEFVKPENFLLNRFLFGTAARLQAGRILIELGAFGGPLRGNEFVAPWLGLGVIL